MTSPKYFAHRAQKSWKILLVHPLPPCQSPLGSYSARGKLWICIDCAAVRGEAAELPPSTLCNLRKVRSARLFLVSSCIAVVLGFEAAPEVYA